MNRGECFNCQTFVDLCGDDCNDWREMANLFVMSINLCAEELAGAYIDNNDVLWYEVAHKFKGLSAMGGAERLQGLCIEAQDNSYIARPAKAILLKKIESEVHMIEETILSCIDRRAEESHGILPSKQV